MLEVLIQEDNRAINDSSIILNRMKSDAERGDFFSVYSIVEQAGLKQFSSYEMEEVKAIGKKGVEDSLRLAMIDAERGIISRMNSYLDLAYKYCSIFSMDISKEAEEIKEVGNKNTREYISSKPCRKHKGIIRIAGYADL